MRVAASPSSLPIITRIPESSKQGAKNWRQAIHSRCFLLLVHFAVQISPQQSHSPIFSAVFVGNQVTIHVGKIEKAEEYRYKHVGKLAKPPYTPERLDEIGPLVPTDLWAEGVSFERGCIDVIFAGLGWICLSGRGRCELTAWAPEGVGVMTRWDSTSRNCCAGAGFMIFLRIYAPNLVICPVKTRVQVAGV